MDGSVNDNRPLIAFVERCERARDLAPLVVADDAPIIVGGITYRVTYDLSTDSMALIPETEWRRRYNVARARLDAVALGEARAIGPCRVSDVRRPAARDGSDWMTA